MDGEGWMARGGWRGVDGEGWMARVLCLNGRTSSLRAASALFSRSLVCMAVSVSVIWRTKSMLASRSAAIAFSDCALSTRCRICLCNWDDCLCFRTATSSRSAASSACSASGSDECNLAFALASSSRASSSACRSASCVCSWRTISCAVSNCVCIDSTSFISLVVSLMVTVLSLTTVLTALAR